MDAEGASSTRDVGDDGVASERNERQKEGGLVVGWKAWGGLNSTLALLAWRWREWELSDRGVQRRRGATGQGERREPEVEAGLCCSGTLGRLWRPGRDGVASAVSGWRRGPGDG